MTIIDDVMPKFRLRQVDRVAVAAPPAEAWRAIESFDGASISYARWFFDLRLLPARIGARLSGRPVPPRTRLGLRDVTAPDTGFFVLGERSGRELCVGSAGKFWQPTIEFPPGADQRFRDFAEPGFGKLAWSLRVDPRDRGASWITFDLRVGATDDAAWKRFQRYWRLIGRFSHLMRRGMLGRFEAMLGKEPPVSSVALPGDEILGAARLARTHSRIIEAPAERVFPWLVQMGATRAGWYSIDAIDSGGVRSAELIIPALQRLRPGDLIPGAPDRPGGFRVLAMEAPRYLVLGTPSLVKGAAPVEGEPPWRDTWAFVVEPIGDDACRLITRIRAEYVPGAKLALMTAFMSGAHAVMGRVQLRNIKRRAEQGTPA